MMNLLLLTFGERLENHYQAAFSILSYLKDPLLKRVIVITDYPEFYRFFEQRIEIIEINSSTLSNWQDCGNNVAPFFWRVKIKALELLQRKYPDEHLLYVDSDTFLATNLTEIQTKLDNNQSVMHIYENALANKKSKTLQKMYLTLNMQTFAGVKIDGKTAMWNAGVIALPKNKAQELISLTLAICDEICATNCPRRLVEQFSFSVSLNHLTTLNACEQIIGHYWGNKPEWNAETSQFFTEALLKNIA